MRGTIAPMALGPGARLGAYEIVESIGAGGMGEATGHATPGSTARHTTSSRERRSSEKERFLSQEGQNHLARREYGTK